MTPEELNVYNDNSLNNTAFETNGNPNGNITTPGNVTVDNTQTKTGKTRKRKSEPKEISQEH